MELTLNRPLMTTYGWLKFNGTKFRYPLSGRTLCTNIPSDPAFVLTDVPSDAAFSMNDVETGMGQDMELTLNRPLMTTYGWLKVNGTKYNYPLSGRTLCTDIPSDPAFVLHDVEAGGMGPDMNQMAGQSDTAPLYFRTESDSERIVRLNFTPEIRKDDAPDGGAFAALNLCAETGSRFTVILDLTAPGEMPEQIALRTKAVVKENAVLRLTVIQRPGAQNTILHDLGVECGENAKFEYVRLMLGGQETYDACRVTLAGNHSSFTAYAGYRLGGHERLDMNWEAIHTGKQTECNIHASGVLREQADKLFRGTIDLRKGCSGSQGTETEDVLLLDETVRNRTLPVILCGEEDVSGNHGATIGRLDENLVYYLESRGLSRETVYALCAQAKLDTVIRKIPDAETIRNLFPDVAEEAET